MKREIAQRVQKAVLKYGRGGLEYQDYLLVLGAAIDALGPMVPQPNDAWYRAVFDAWSECGEMSAAKIVVVALQFYDEVANSTEEGDQIPPLQSACAFHGASTATTNSLVSSCTDTDSQAGSSTWDSAAWGSTGAHLDVAADVAAEAARLDRAQNWRFNFDQLYVVAGKACAKAGMHQPSRGELMDAFKGASGQRGYLLGDELVQLVTRWVCADEMCAMTEMPSRTLSEDAYVYSPEPFAWPTDLGPAPRIQVTTWNCAGQGVCSFAEAQRLLLPPAGEPMPDIVAVAVQELVDLTPANMWSNGVYKNDQRDNLESLVLRVLCQACWQREGRPDDYARLEHASTVGLHLVVMARRRVLADVSFVAVDVLKTGVGGYAGNKGAVGVIFCHCGVWGSFVNVHLAAGGAKKSEDRNDHLRHIFRCMFNRCDGVGRSHGKARAIGNWLRGRPGEEGVNVDRCHWTILSGDFNYRLALDDVSALDFASQSNWPELLKHDQFVQGHVPPQLLSFAEPVVDFPPTYKYAIGTGVRNATRGPAWCDRIFSRGPLLRRRYSSTALTFSDHHPVTATFDFQTVLSTTDNPMTIDEYLKA